MANTIHKFLGRLSFRKNSSNPIASLQTQRTLAVVFLQKVAAQSKERRSSSGMGNKSKSRYCNLASRYCKSENLNVSVVLANQLCFDSQMLQSVKKK
mmetsp:Transcript_13912/g.25217  ORF Transcript_13912/g.25217 Transcript_13912/m.25217 type:complete len:97 (+) Transcript_13912:2698-2988(+)